MQRCPRCEGDPEAGIVFIARSTGAKAATRMRMGKRLAKLSLQASTSNAPLSFAEGISLG